MTEERPGQTIYRGQTIPLADQTLSMASRASRSLSEVVVAIYQIVL